MAAELSIQVNPTFGATTAVSTPTDGTFTADAYSFRIVFWERSSETDLDTGGYAIVDSLQENVAVASSHKVIYTCTHPPRYYDHIAVYWQDSSTNTGAPLYKWDFTNDGT